MTMFDKVLPQGKSKKFLREKEVSLKLTQRIANTGIWEWDCTKDDFYFADETCQICGISKDVTDIDLQHFIDNFICNEYKNVVRDALKEALKYGGIEKIEYKILNSNKEEKWVRTNCEVLYDESGEPNKVIGTIQDINEWKETETSIRENLEALQRVIDTLPNPIFCKDLNGVYRHCNVAFCEYLGLEYQEVIGRSVYDLCPKELADIYHKFDSELIVNRGKQTYESKIRHKDKTLHDVIFNKAVITDLQNEPMGLVGIATDITDRKIAEKRIQRLLKLKEASIEINHAIIGINNTNELFNLILEKVSEVIEEVELSCVMLLDKDENLRIAACKGFDEEKAKEFRLKLRETFFWFMTKGNFHRAVVINDIQELINKKFPDILENDKRVEVQSSISSPIIIDGKLYGLVNVDSSRNRIYDEMDLEVMEYLRNQIAIVINKHRLYEETIYLSRYDRLTNIYNRSYFEELFEAYIKEASKDNKEFYLVLFDLNGLKFVNDTYGHLAGDRLIKTFSSSLRKFIESQTILARFGGDEFVAVFSDRDICWLKNKFTELSQYLKSRPITFEGNRISCEFSYGIAKFPDDSNEYNQLVRAADERMYTYKKRLKKIHRTF
ncbi:diguanylate cyclase [Wukongibacter baidiensis]|uniref:sensor domain-containing diguanylate cyclase n=1 Tax=Wukongibacter baidiensis TaxID=1723361 RepID=UPI003D7FF9E2